VALLGRWDGPGTGSAEASSILTKSRTGSGKRDGASCLHERRITGAPHAMPSAFRSVQPKGRLSSASHSTALRRRISRRRPCFGSQPVAVAARSASTPSAARIAGPISMCPLGTAEV
jgi:hypothetical protein